MELLYSVRAGGVDAWVKILGLAAVAGIIGGAIVAVLDSTTAGVVLAVIFVLTVVLIWPILPQRYEVWSDRLSLIFPLWRWDLALDSIANVRAATRWEPFAFAGWRFATAPGKAVTVERRDANMFTRPSVVISPEDRERFLEAMHAALTR
jgi:hypothetical protein